MTASPPPWFLYLRMWRSTGSSDPPHPALRAPLSVNGEGLVANSLAQDMPQRGFEGCVLEAETGGGEAGGLDALAAEQDAAAHFTEE